MRVFIVTNNSGFIVGVFDSQSKASSARIKAEMDGVVDCFIQSAIMNGVFTGVDQE